MGLDPTDVGSTPTSSSYSLDRIRPCKLLAGIRGEDRYRATCAAAGKVIGDTLIRCP